mgnify:CR=1 FL=1
MQRSRRIGAVALLICTVAALAADYPLQVKNMSLEEARACPGGYGAYGDLQKKMPGVTKTPAAVSKHPLFARMQSYGPASEETSTAAKWILYFDESKGTGKGYDRMIVDVNANGDLTDDPVVQKATQEGRDANVDNALFGPVEVPASMAVGQWRPRFCVELYVYNREGLNIQGDGGRVFIGRIQARAGNYLETTVDLNGVKQRIAVVDGNCNFKLGESAQMLEANRGQGRQSYYLYGRDWFLRDFNNDGRFVRTLGDTEAEHFSALIDVGGQPFSTALSDDLKSLRLEPYAGSVGKVKVEALVTGFIVGWEKAEGQWEAVTPAIQNGFATLPAGKLRLCACSVGAKNPEGRWVRGESSDVGTKTFNVAPGGESALELGPPFKLQITYTKGSNRGESGGALGAVRSLFGGSGGSSATVLQMNVTTSGAAGEQYSSFIQEGVRTGTVPPPKFEIIDENSKVVGTGNFEYG